MKKWMTGFLVLTGLAGILICSGCGAAEIGPSAESDVQAAVLDVAAEPEYPAAPDYEEDFDAWRAYVEENILSEEELTGVRQFAYRTGSQLLKEGTENENYSPASLYFALSLAAMGAGGETLEEFQALLGADDQAALAEQCGRLYRALYADGSRYGEGIASQCRIADSMWMKQGMKFEDDFIQTAKEDFYSSLFTVDFAQESTADQMSEWVKENTGGKIQPKMEFDPQQVLSIINTIYFYDEWIDRFDASKTAEASFHLEDGTERVHEFMHRGTSGGFSTGENFVRARLGLKEAGSMVFVLPAEGTSVDDLLADEEALRNVLEGGEDHYGIITWQVPKFSYGSKYDLAEDLKELGLVTAFGEEADFSSMTQDSVWINAVKQETHIGIDENGVEAAAYTEIAMSGAGLPQDRADMILDRPFLYAIEAGNGVPLFIGVYRGME